MAIPKDHPFVFIDPVWHALECSRCDEDLPQHRMRCGLEVKGRLAAMATEREDPGMNPRCLTCVEMFFAPKGGSADPADWWKHTKG